MNKQKIIYMEDIEQERENELPLFFKEEYIESDNKKLEENEEVIDNEVKSRSISPVNSIQHSEPEAEADEHSEPESDIIIDADPVKMFKFLSKHLRQLDHLVHQDYMDKTETKNSFDTILNLQTETEDINCKILSSYYLLSFIVREDFANHFMYKKKIRCFVKDKIDELQQCGKLDEEIAKINKKYF